MSAENVASSAQRRLDTSSTHLDFLWTTFHRQQTSQMVAREVLTTHLLDDTLLQHGQDLLHAGSTGGSGTTRRLRERSACTCRVTGANDRVSSCESDAGQDEREALTGRGSLTVRALLRWLTILALLLLSVLTLLLGRLTVLSLLRLLTVA